MKTEKLVKRTVLMIIAVCVMGMGVAVLQMTNFGPDPCSALNYAVSNKIGLSFGNYQLLFNILLFLLLFFQNRKLFGLGTIGNMVLVGYSADFTTWILKEVLHVPTELSVGVRVGIMIAALAIFICAAATYMNCGLGTSPYDAFSFFIHQKIEKISGKTVPFLWIRIAYDGTVTLIAYIIGRGIGVVTILMIVLLGPAIDYFAKIVKKWIG